MWLYWVWVLSPSIFSSFACKCHNVLVNSGTVFSYYCCSDNTELIFPWGSLWSHKNLNFSLFIHPFYLHSICIISFRSIQNTLGKAVIAVARIVFINTLLWYILVSFSICVWRWNLIGFIPSQIKLICSSFEVT